MAIHHIIKRKTLNNRETAVVLIHTENFLNFGFPGNWIERARLKLILKFLNAQDSESFNEGLLATLGYRRVLLLNLLAVENFREAITDNLNSGFEGLHVGVGPT